MSDWHKMSGKFSPELVPDDQVSGFPDEARQQVSMNSGKEMAGKAGRKWQQISSQHSVSQRSQESVLTGASRQLENTKEGNFHVSCG